jgi:uncharacterized RDD family membrane protein YckC
MNKDEDREVTTETLSTPPLKLVPAQILDRCAGGIVDGLAVTILWQSLSFFIGYGLNPLTELPSYGSVTILALIALVYFFLCEGLSSSTVGKSSSKLTVVNESGDACSIRESFKRNLLRFIDWLPLLYAVGGVSVLVSSKRKRIGDRLARTKVTKKRERDPNPPSSPFPFH